MKINSKTSKLKSFHRRSQREIFLRARMKVLMPVRGISISSNSFTVDTICNVDQQSSVLNNRLQNILTYHRTLHNSHSELILKANQLARASVPLNDITCSKTLKFCDSSFDTVQHQTVAHGLENSFDDDDDDWSSIASDDGVEEGVIRSEMESEQKASTNKDNKLFSSTSTSHATNDRNAVFAERGKRDEEEEEEAEEEQQQYDGNCSRPHTSLEIAVLLALFRHRHSLSKSCLTDICRLLRLLGIRNVPPDYRSIYKLINPRGNSMFQPKVSIVCPSCFTINSNVEKCSVIDCKSYSGYTRSPTINFTFEIAEQIKSILERVPLMKTDQNHTDVYDVIDGTAYRRIRTLERKPFVTLTLNSDGVLVKKISRSLWITSMVINEIPRNVRFKLPNMIIGMISYGSQKPKRAEFQQLSNVLVDQLVNLEQGIDVHLANSYDTRRALTDTTTVSVYLLGVVADKPAQSVLQNTTDSGGFFGCTNCEIVGVSVRAGKGFVRSFPFDATDSPVLRSNDTYDKAMNKLKKNKKQCMQRNAFTTVMNEETKGHVGPCPLRRLRYFDMGHSFMIDSLHNLYSGAFLRLLKIWLEPPSKRNNTTSIMSIFNHRRQVEVSFDSLRFPSSTYRTPRRLKFFNQFKASELRLCLLMGYNCFQSVLSKKQYKHLQALAFALHLSESKFVNDQVTNDIDLLLSYFNKKFECLYTKRHIVSVVHSVAHVSSSVREFGPLMNYSTFNFESLIGTLVRTVRDPNQPSTEICFNLELLHRSWLEVNTNQFSFLFKLFIKQINSQSKQTAEHSIRNPLSPSIRLYHRIEVPLDICILMKNQQYEFYRTMFYKGTTFSYKTFSTTSRTHDGCILYYTTEDVTKMRIGFIQGFIRLINIGEPNIMVVVDQIKITSLTDCLMIDNVKYECCNVLQGHLCPSKKLVLLQPQQIKEKLAFRVREGSNENNFFFYRYPNFCEST